MSFSIFPAKEQTLLNELSDYRQKLFKEYNDNSISTLSRIESFIGHKAVSVITIPVDLTGCAIGITGMVGSACILGAFKVFVFAITLGNIECKFSTGFLWFEKKTTGCITDLTLNLSEFIADGENGCIHVYNTMLKAAAKLHISGFVKKVFHQIDLLVHFMTKRLQRGFDQAYLCEKKYGFVFSLKTPSFLHWIDKPTSECRLQPDETRPLSKILKHSIASIVNIPLNATVALVGLAASAILTSAYVGKSLFSAVTNIDIPVPVAVAPVVGATLATTINASIDTVNCMVDVAILVYKTAEVTGLINVAATMKDLLLYIPRACFN